MFDYVWLPSSRVGMLRESRPLIPFEWGMLYVSSTFKPNFSASRTDRFSRDTGYGYYCQAGTSCLSTCDPITGEDCCSGPQSFSFSVSFPSILYSSSSAFVYSSSSEFLYSSSSYPGLPSSSVSVGRPTDLPNNSRAMSSGVASTNTSIAGGNPNSASANFIPDSRGLLLLGVLAGVLAMVL